MADANLQQRLYQALRQALLDGRFQPGEALKIRDLASAWGTSPMPVRAALQRLVAEGALEGEPQRSVRVPPMTEARFRQLFEVRLSLEGLAAELACPRVTAEALAQLEAEVAEMDAALQRRDIRTYLAANSRFHLALYGACDNPLLLRLIESLWLQVGPFFNRLFTEADLNLRLNGFHDEACRALRTGDARAVRHAVEQDLRYCGQYLAGLLRLEADAPARKSGAAARAGRGASTRTRPGQSASALGIPSRAARG
ncbi:GntR family transcriptional regulator [Pseudomonas mangiferae]|uniref:GntR family transcriptional regulator n=1 Tax=Pseudomonas mangiferae TaxID=2593654 RepID=A0A553GWL8_9PSED|nr:GntR family transcriptional regulator [Pseudomonas mangiferae]TRX73900.1 GntR family transcriptional regulator [Pseudomonas mangiferae]